MERTAAVAGGGAGWGSGRRVRATVAAMGAHGLHAHPTPDVTIDYFAAGTGRSLVLVHGITESRRTWDPLLAPLIAAGYRVTAIDLRGHGD